MVNHQEVGGGGGVHITGNKRSMDFFLLLLIRRHVEPAVHRAGECSCALYPSAVQCCQVYGLTVEFNSIVEYSTDIWSSEGTQRWMEDFYRIFYS